MKTHKCFSCNFEEIPLKFDLCDRCRDSFDINKNVDVDNCNVLDYTERLEDGFALMQANEHPDNYDDRWS